jgi:crotonobetainyl-CoA:carnitine CoA-transferase CaiB-like acyl-CoA transferase
MTYLTAYAEEAPMGLGYAYADMVSGLYGAISILAALEYRERVGQGQYIDLSEYEAMCTTIGPALMDTHLNMRKIKPMGNDDVYSPAAPHGCYRCLGEDRWCVLAIFTEDEWQALCGVLGNPAPLRDKRFSTMFNRKKYRQELDLLISQWMAKQKAETVVEQLQRAGVAAGVVQNAEDLANDPQFSANDFFTSLNHPVLGEIKTDTTPLNFNNYLRGAWKASPLLGEANQYVFGELLGMTETDIQSYIQQGVIS